MHSKELASNGAGQIVPKLNSSDGTAAMSDSTYLQPTPMLGPPPEPGPVQVMGDRHYGNRLEALLSQRKPDPTYLQPTPVPVVDGLALTALGAPSVPKHITRPYDALVGRRWDQLLQVVNPPPAKQPPSPQVTAQRGLTDPELRPLGPDDV